MWVAMATAGHGEVAGPLSHPAELWADMWPCLNVKSEFPGT